MIIHSILRKQLLLSERITLCKALFFIAEQAPYTAEINTVSKQNRTLQRVQSG